MLSQTLQKVNEERRRNKPIYLKMLNKSGEILALINLIDDPDEEIFLSITQKFVALGESVIPILTEEKEFCHDESISSKIDSIIYEVSFSSLKKSLEKWDETSEISLKDASIILSKFIDQKTDIEALEFEIEKIKRSVWLELNDYLTPLEVVNIFNKIFFSYYRFKCHEISSSQFDDFGLTNLLIRKTGNVFSMGSLYMIISDLLNLPIRSTHIQGQHLIGYFTVKNSYTIHEEDEILFFIDPISGQIYTHSDIEIYLKKISESSTKDAVKPISNKGYISKWIKELARIQKKNGEITRSNELIQLSEKYQDQ